MSLQPENALYDLVSTATSALQNLLADPSLTYEEKVEWAHEVVAELTDLEFRWLCPDDSVKMNERLRWHEVGRCAIETSVLRGQDAAFQEISQIELEDDGLFSEFCGLFRMIVLDDPMEGASLQQVRAFRHLMDGLMLPVAMGRMGLYSAIRALTEARIAVLSFTENGDDDPDDGETIAA